MSIRQLKSLSKIKGEEDFESKTIKQQQKIIAILMSQVSCERDAAEKALELQEKACAKQGKIVGKGGSRRRRRGRRSTSSDSGSDSDTSTSTQSTAPPAPVQQTAQAAPAQAAPAPAQGLGGDIYDLLSVIIVGGGAYMAGSYALAAGLDDGMTALMEANGVGSLQSCAPEEQLARKLNAAALGYQVPDYCTQAESNMNALIIAAPLAATTLCSYFGVRNPVSIIADTARSARRSVAEGLRHPVDTIVAAREKVSEGLRRCFGRRAPVPESVVNAAQLAAEAQNAAMTAARTSPNPTTAQTAALQAGQQVVNPTISPRTTPTSPAVVPSPPRTVAAAMNSAPAERVQLDAMLSPVAEGDTSPPAMSSLSRTPTPTSPAYSPTTPPVQDQEASMNQQDESSDEEDEDEDEMEEGEIVEQVVAQSTTPTSIGSVSSVDDQGRSIRRSSRRRRGGKKKNARKTHKNKAKKARKAKKAKKSRKHKHKAKKTRKHKNKAHKTRKHKGKKKGKKTRKH